MNITNNNFQQNMYQQMPQYNNQYENNYIGYPQNINTNNPYMMGSTGSNFNNSPYNMNLINKGYPPQNDFKRISLEKEKQQNFDMNITDINGTIIFKLRTARKDY